MLHLYIYICVCVKLILSLKRYISFTYVTKNYYKILCIFYVSYKVDQCLMSVQECLSKINCMLINKIKFRSLPYVPFLWILLWHKSKGMEQVFNNKYVITYDSSINLKLTIDDNWRYNRFYIIVQSGDKISRRAN